MDIVTSKKIYFTPKLQFNLGIVTVKLCIVDLEK